MKKSAPALTLGLEEEQFLVSQQTGELCGDWPRQLLLYFNKHYPGQIVREYISSQVELITKPCQSVVDLEQQLLSLRQIVQEQAEGYRLALMAASTHPTAEWRKQHPNDLSRYRELRDKLQVAARRLLTGGMHIHIGIEDPELRLNIMNRLVKFLPLILSLTTSSPFWGGEDTGMSSYRVSVLKGLPRSGFPPLFHNYEAFLSYIRRLQKAKAVTNGRELWWDMRLNVRYPTVEVRIADTCTKVADAMACAALIQSLAHHFVYQPKDFDIDTEYHLALENKWRAQRYPIADASLISFEESQLISVSDILAHLVEQLEDDARQLGCLNHLRHCREIVRSGTSSDKQRRVYQDALTAGDTPTQALEKVKRYLIKASQSAKQSCKQQA